MLNLFRRGKTDKAAADRLYVSAVTRAREPVFFVTFGVSDTLDGRFDLLTLHAWLVLARLNSDLAQTGLAQAFVNRVFIGFDEALRELGAGDMGMGRRMKKLADAFYGRLTAYSEASASDDAPAAMTQALNRNLYRGTPTPHTAQITEYVLTTNQHLALTPDGGVDFGVLPEKD